VGQTASPRPRQKKRCGSIFLVTAKSFLLEDILQILSEKPTEKRGLRPAFLLVENTI
jgi:hypothetical protein